MSLIENMHARIVKDLHVLSFDVLLLLFERLEFKNGIQITDFESFVEVAVEVRDEDLIRRRLNFIPCSRELIYLHPKHLSTDQIEFTEFH